MQHLNKESGISVGYLALLNFLLFQKLEILIKAISCGSCCIVLEEIFWMQKKMIDMVQTPKKSIEDIAVACDCATQVGLVLIYF